MFEAMINGRIDCRGLEFDVHFADIEELNRGVCCAGDIGVAGSTDGDYGRPDVGRDRGAADVGGGFGALDVGGDRGGRGCEMLDRGAADVSKISYAVLPQVVGRYELLSSGSALGHGNGPVLVARPEVVGLFDADPCPTLRGQSRQRPPSGGCGGAEALGTEIIGAGVGAHEVRIAVPGIHTTANLLMQRLFPQFTNRIPVLFSDIAPAVARGRFDAGVLIHEGRFTYHNHGLELLCDLGEEWARVTCGLPLPLGAIVASRRLPEQVRRTVEVVLRDSIQYALNNPAVSREFIRAHAQEVAATTAAGASAMDLDEVIDNHIRLFVNDNSLSLSPAARQAISELTGVRV